MNQEKYILLLYKQLRGDLSPLEEQELNGWLAESADNQQIKKQIFQSMDLLEDYEPRFSVDLEEDFETIRAQLNLTKRHPSAPQQAKEVTMSTRRSWLGIAASLALLIAAGFWIWEYQVKPRELVVWETGKEEIKEIKLPDGTKVWLNENSKLSHEKAYVGKVRGAKLRGEAFFDVAKDSTKTFTIKTAVSTVEVLGTSFNVRAIEQENQTTLTVKTGKVRFFITDTKKEVVLTPNQEAVLDHAKKEIDLPREVWGLNALAWQSKKLDFANTPLPEVFEVLEKYFKVEIVSNNPALKDCRLTLQIENPELISIWSTLSTLYNIEVEEKSANKLVISKGGC